MLINNHVLSFCSARYHARFTEQIEAVILVLITLAIYQLQIGLVGFVLFNDTWSQ